MQIAFRISIYPQRFLEEIRILPFHHSIRNPQKARHSFDNALILWMLAGLMKATLLTLTGSLLSLSAFAATTSGKDGLQSSGGYAAPTGNLPIIATGVQEFGLSGYLNWEDTTRYALSVSYGRFFSDNWLLGGRVGVDGQNSDAGYSIGAFAEYNFLTQSPWVPFVGFSADYNRLEYKGDSLDALRLGLELGVKYFFRPNIAASLSGGAAWNTDSFPDGDDFAKQINLGLRYYF